MATVIVTPKAGPVLLHDLFDRHLLHRNQVEPEQHSPQPVLLTYVIRAGAETFLVYRVVMMAGWLPGLVVYLMGSVRFKEMLAVERAAEAELAHPPAEETEGAGSSASHG